LRIREISDDCTWRVLSRKDGIAGWTGIGRPWAELNVRIQQNGKIAVFNDAHAIFINDIQFESRGNRCNRNGEVIRRTNCHSCLSCKGAEEHLRIISRGKTILMKCVEIKRMDPMQVIQLLCDGDCEPSACIGTQMVVGCVENSRGSYAGCPEDLIGIKCLYA